MATNVEIIIGTYEEFLLGYKLDTKNDKEVLVQSFADKSHSGSLKCLSVQGRWIATGATDDRIFIYDMKSRKQSQILLTHEGTINALSFTPDETHLLSGGDDGRMIAVRLNTWFTEATWKKAHSGSAVTHISCHPSGKLALSLGSDLVLRTWNLVKGRVAYKTNLKSRNTLGSMPDCLAWSTSGDYFTLTGQRVVEIWSIKSADVVKSQKTTSKPISVSWVADNECLVGLEDGKILWVSVDEVQGKEIVIEAHNSRVKAMNRKDDILVTASSSGEIKMWHIIINKKKLKEIASTNIGCRPTCIGILGLEQFGSEYVVSKTIGQQKEETIKLEKKAEPRERGVVTIEYENDAEAGDNEEENDADSVSEEEDDIDEKQNEAENDDDSDSDDATNSENSDDDENEEPQIRLPKSRKRKQQIINKQNLAKTPKLGKSSSAGKNNKKNKQQETHSSQKKKKLNKK